MTHSRTGWAAPRRRSMRRRAGWLAAALLSAALACRRGAEPAPPPQPPPALAAPEAAGEPFTMADLAAATRLDAAFQRLNALAAEYKASLTFDRGPRVTEHTDQVARRLGEAVAALDGALDRVRDPRDRARATPIAAAARRWPALLRAARDELLASARPATRAADALSATDDEIVRALDAYRAFRSGWRLADSPDEGEPVLAFLRARRALETTEADLARGLPETAGAGGAKPDPAALRAKVDAAIAEARTAADGIGDGRKAAALRFVDAEAQALAALASMSAPGALDEQRGRDALSYQVAKVAALEAVADYVEATASGAPAAEPASRPAKPVRPSAPR